MRVRFTKMQGAGNDFVVLDETQGRLGLTRQQYRFLADRHFGVGADQILTVRGSDEPGIDFEYVIHNADGGQVQQCGNGARCFVRYVRDKGLTQRDRIRVRTLGGVIEPELAADGRVRVDMGPPRFAPEALAFDGAGLETRQVGAGELYPLELASGQTAWAAVASMGNPHAVLRVDQTSTALVEEWGAQLEGHPRFAERVNVGFMQIVSPRAIRLRVFERGVGETLACGSGACAAVACGVRLGWLDAGQPIEVHTHGGDLDIVWAGEGHSVMMTGPATTVFEGEIDLPSDPANFSDPIRETA